MDLIEEIDGIVLTGRSDKDVGADLARYVRRAIIPLSLFELQKVEFLPRDWDVLEHVLMKAEEAKAVFKKDILDAPGLIKVGNLMFCKNDMPKAQELYRRSIEVQEFTVAYKNLGVALLNDLRPVEARAAFEKAIAKDDKDVQVMFYLGLTWEAVAEGRTTAPGGGLMASTSLTKAQTDKHLKKALEYYDRALAMDPKFGPALYNKSVVLTMLGRKEEAREVITDMLKGQPASEAGWIARGLILRSTDDVEGALKCYENAITINQESHLAWLNKSVVLFTLKRLEEALIAADRAIELNKLSEIAWSNKGAVLSELGRFEEAIVCFDKAVELNPQFEGAIRNRNKAKAALEKGHPAIKAGIRKARSRTKAKAPQKKRSKPKNKRKKA